MSGSDGVVAIWIGRQEVPRGAACGDDPLSRIPGRTIDEDQPAVGAAGARRQPGSNVTV